MGAGLLASIVVAGAAIGLVLALLAWRRRRRAMLKAAERARMEEEKRHEAAALLLQAAIHHGRQARAEAERRRKARRRLKAAMRIQAFSRRRIARRLVVLMRDIKAVRAIVRLQAAARRRIAIKRAEAARLERLEQAAAAVLQAHIRGWLSRVRFAKWQGECRLHFAVRALARRVERRWRACRRWRAMVEALAASRDDDAPPTQPVESPRRLIGSFVQAPSTPLEKGLENALTSIAHSHLWKALSLGERRQERIVLKHLALCNLRLPLKRRVVFKALPTRARIPGGVGMADARRFLRSSTARAAAPGTTMPSPQVLPPPKRPAPRGLPPLLPPERQPLPPPSPSAVRAYPFPVQYPRPWPARSSSTRSSARASPAPPVPALRTHARARSSPRYSPRIPGPLARFSRAPSRARPGESSAGAPIEADDATWSRPVLAEGEPSKSRPPSARDRGQVRSLGSFMREGPGAAPSCGQQHSDAAPLSWRDLVPTSARATSSRGSSSPRMLPFLHELEDEEEHERGGARTRGGATRRGAHGGAPLDVPAQFV